MLLAVRCTLIGIEEDIYYSLPVCLEQDFHEKDYARGIGGGVELVYYEVGGLEH